MSQWHAGRRRRLQPLGLTKQDLLGGTTLERVDHVGQRGARSGHGERYEEDDSTVQNEARAWFVSRHETRLLSDEMRKENPAISGFRQILAAD